MKQTEFKAKARTQAIDDDDMEIILTFPAGGDRYTDDQDDDDGMEIILVFPPKRKTKKKQRKARVKT